MHMLGMSADWIVPAVTVTETKGVTFAGGGKWATRT